VLSVTPPRLRPVVANHELEHFAAFLLTGIAVGLGYPYRWRLHSLALLAYTGAVELAQLLAPGRHARLSDFAVNAGSAWLGIILAFSFSRITRAEGPPRGTGRAGK
jgi:VanZ family protein